MSFAEALARYTTAVVNRNNEDEILAAQAEVVAAVEALVPAPAPTVAEPAPTPAEGS